MIIMWTYMEADDACPEGYATCWEEWEIVTMMCTDDKMLGKFN